MRRANYRAVREHGGSLIVPRAEELPGVVEANRKLAAGYGFGVLGEPVQRLRESARSSVLAIPDSCRSRGHGGDGAGDPSGAIVLTGHQPELFHPGVWLKNFVAGRLAAACGGVAVNLNVDNDEVRQGALRAPVVRGGRVEAVEVRYVGATEGRACEELEEGSLRCGVAAELRSLGVAERLCEAVEDFWGRLDAARGHGSLARVIICGRHQIEREAGLRNREALASEMARTAAYRRFMLDIMAGLDRFHEAYNGGLRTFRRVHHERNAAQPVPDLAVKGGRWEMPFWVWRRGGRRERLWVERQRGRYGLCIGEEEGAFAEIEEAALREGGGDAIGELDAQEAEGIRIRPRALTLTLFARMFAGDVFVHGLGGAIYDKVTDEIARSYYGVEPPRAVMATGTALLPLDCFDATEGDRRALLRRLRDIRHNPDRLMDEGVRGEGETRRLVERKRHLIHGGGETRAVRRAAWHELRGVNERLAGRLAGEPRATRRRLEEVEDRLSQNRILKDREYSIALHPREELIAFYSEVTGPIGGKAP